MNYGRKGYCRKRVIKCVKTVRETQIMCADISGYGKTTLCRIYGKAPYLPCLHTNGNGDTAHSLVVIIRDAVVLGLERDPHLPGWMD